MTTNGTTNLDTVPMLRRTGLKTLLRELATDHDQRGGRTAPIRITHAQLAGVLHLSRETVSRMLSQMAGEGCIELGRGVIRVQL